MDVEIYACRGASDSMVTICRTYGSYRREEPAQQFICTSNEMAPNQTILICVVHETANDWDGDWPNRMLEERAQQTLRLQYCRIQVGILGPNIIIRIMLRPNNIWVALKQNKKRKRKYYQTTETRSGEKEKFLRGIAYDEYVRSTKTASMRSSAHPPPSNPLNGLRSPTEASDGESPDSVRFHSMFSLVSSDSAHTVGRVSENVCYFLHSKVICCLEWRDAFTNTALLGCCCLCGKRLRVSHKTQKDSFRLSKCVFFPFLSSQQQLELDKRCMDTVVFLPRAHIHI